MEAFEMPSFNPDDIDFDLNNIRAEQDWRIRMHKEHNNWNFSCEEKRGLPIDGDALIDAKVNNPKLTSTLADFYNKVNESE
jgi:hypothetical protein